MSASFTKTAIIFIIAYRFSFYTLIINTYLSSRTMVGGPALNTSTCCDTTIRFIARAIAIILASLNTFARWAPFPFWAFAIGSTSYADPNALIIFTIITVWAMRIIQAFFTSTGSLTTVGFPRRAIIIVSASYNALIRPAVRAQRA